jgi:deoxycytidine triphosphate deaminase
MFGNIMNNKQIKSAMSSGIINIAPFSEGRLKNIHYSLTPQKILHKSDEDVEGNYQLISKKDFSSDPSPYIFGPNEFCVVEIEEHIALTQFVVGHFIPSSKVVTKGLGLTAGRIEAPFGTFQRRKQMIRFSVENLTDKPIRLSEDETIAHIYFVDLRGLDNFNVDVSKSDQKMLKDWDKRRYRADDDGPYYSTEE